MPTHPRLRALVVTLTPALSCADTTATNDPAGDSAQAGEPIGDAEGRYIAAAGSLAESVDTLDCAGITSFADDYTDYSGALTNRVYQDLASTRFKPMVDYLSRKLCNEFEIAGDLASYEADAVEHSPAGAYLSGTPLLQAVIDESTTVNSLLATANTARAEEGLSAIIIADYPNSIVGGPTSTVLYFPGWPDRPELDQWVQVQRTINQLLLIALEPQVDGTYISFAHRRDLEASGSTTTVGDTVVNGTCLQCHHSGRPPHMGVPDSARAAR